MFLGINLVAETPDHDGCVVVVLNDQLLHLGDGVLAAAGHMLGDVGDLRPDDQTLFVTQIVEILIVLVVSQTDGGCTDLHDEVDVLLMMLGEQGVTHAPSVLMAGHTAQGVRCNG